ncbi:MAG TPA: glycosyltransferase family 4 protein [Kiloniellales bacterium]|jgi:glycosyltransferase involved in cell wall biosynthesis
MTSRRVLFIVTKLSKGGAMVVPLQVAAALRARGYEAETWFLYQQQPAFEDEPGVRVILPRRAAGLLDYVRVFLRLIPAMRAFRPDAVHGVLPLGNIFGLLAAVIVGCPSRVASQHNPAKTHNPIMRLMDKAWGTLGIYTGNIAVSYSVRDSYARYPAAYVRRLHVVQNGMRVRPASLTKAEARAHFGLPAQMHTIGTMGRLAHQKNQDFLFAAMARLPGVHMAIAGDGELRQKFQQQIASAGLADRIHLLGAIPPADVPNFLAALDLFVLPSLYEGLPIALIEAMQAGCPIVASDIPPTIEVVLPDGGEAAAAVLGMDSVEPWIDTIRDLLAQPEKRQALAAAAHRRSAYFSLDRMTDGYIACLFPHSSPSSTRK